MVLELLGGQALLERRVLEVAALEHRDRAGLRRSLELVVVLYRGYPLG
jgi:hypothetical protein